MKTLYKDFPRYYDLEKESDLNEIISRYKIDAASIEDYLEQRYNEIEEFLVNIFSQDPDKAYRRIRYFCAERLHHGKRRLNRDIA